MSETVKLIIEISKATYEDLKSGKIYSSLCEAPQGLVEGIRNGVPLGARAFNVINNISKDGEKLTYAEVQLWAKAHKVVIVSDEWYEKAVSEMRALDRITRMI